MVIVFENIEYNHCSSKCFRKALLLIIERYFYVYLLDWMYLRPTLHFHFDGLASPYSDSKLYLSKCSPICSAKSILLRNPYWGGAVADWFFHSQFPTVHWEGPLKMYNVLSHQECTSQASQTVDQNAKPHYILFKINVCAHSAHLKSDWQTWNESSPTNTKSLHTPEVRAIPCASAVWL